MAKEVQLLSYWMPILRNLKEFKEIAKSEEPEVKRLLEEIDTTLDNLFIETADEYGIKRFEKMMGITPSEGDTLETRRFKALLKWSDKVPYTEEVLKSLLEVLCGADGFTIKIDYSKYNVVVKLALGTEANAKAVSELLERVTPANMVTKVMLFNTHSILSDFTHKQLAQYTQKEVREELL